MRFVVIVAVCVLVAMLAGPRPVDAHQWPKSSCKLYANKAKPLTVVKWRHRYRMCVRRHRANHARSNRKKGMITTTATWYGPGFYGKKTACGQVYSTSIRGVAHMTLPCGTLVDICSHVKCTRVPVIDTGGFDKANFDLSARTAMNLCSCSRPYTMRVKWMVAS